MKNKKRRMFMILAALVISAMVLLCGCQGTAAQTSGDASAAAGTATTAAAEETQESDLFTERDLEQSPDLTDAVYMTVEEGQTVTITEEGVYVLSGTASEAQIVVEAADDAKVQLVLDGLTLTNSNTPCIYVKSADKVFVTTAEGSENSLTVTGAFTADGDTNTDAVIFSKDDLVLNGKGTLTVESTDHGIVSKDDLKITGSTWNVTAAGDGIKSNDSLAIADGTLDITAEEAIESTQIVINGGNITVQASDDGINASQKSDKYTPLLRINGGEITVTMGQGDTDALDSNGDLIINGGTVTLNAQSPFDYEGNGELNGGTVTVNGQQITELTNQMMGGGMQGAPQGDPNFSEGQGGMQGPGGGQPPQRPEGGQPPQMPGEQNSSSDVSWT